jgi:hypothetical protein
MTLSRLAARYATLAAPAFVPAPSLILRTGQVLILCFKISFRMCHPFGMNAASFRFFIFLRMRAPNRMAEILDFQIAYSLRSEIRKKILSKNYAARSSANNFFKNSGR